MALREVKKALNEMDKTEIIRLVSDIYKKIPDAKSFLDIFVTGDVTELAKKYKKEIEKYIYPTGRDMNLREGEARKIIRAVGKMKIAELNIELELHYVACCLDIIENFGYWNENYYIALEKMFFSAINTIYKLEMEEKYETQIMAIANKASKYGIELLY